MHKLAAKRLRLDRVSVIVNQQRFNSDSDSTDDMEDSIKFCNRSSEGDGRIYFHEESQNEQNAVEHIDCGLDPSGSEIDSVDLIASEIVSDDNSIVSSETEAQEDVDSISSESNEENDLSDEEQVHFANKNEKAQYVRTAVEE